MYIPGHIVWKILVRFPHFHYKLIWVDRNSDPFFSFLQFVNQISPNELCMYSLQQHFLIYSTLILAFRRYLR